MFERIDQCPICNSQQFTASIICQDYLVSQESFALVKCDRCDLVLTNPRPEPAEIHKYYASDQYISHTDKGNDFINFIYKLARNYTIRQKINLITKHTKSSHDPLSLLDYGCGTGNFLESCSKKGWNIWGVEPDEGARELAIATTKSDAIFSSIEEIPTGIKFEVITLWHVLEHIHNLNEALQQIGKRLFNKGILVIAVPNYKAYDAMLYKEHWAGYDVPRHLFHFTQKSMSTLLKNHNLRIADIVPQKLDAYYVSLLSEKYIKGTLSLKSVFNSFISGWKSNSYGKNNNMEYSSLIYMVKKQH